MSQSEKFMKIQLIENQTVYLCLFFVLAFGKFECGTDRDILTNNGLFAGTSKYIDDTGEKEEMEEGYTQSK